MTLTFTNQAIRGCQRIGTTLGEIAVRHEHGLCVPRHRAVRRWDLPCDGSEEISSCGEVTLGSELTNLFKCFSTLVYINAGTTLLRGAVA